MALQSHCRPHLHARAVPGHPLQAPAQGQSPPENEGATMSRWPPGPRSGPGLPFSLLPGRSFGAWRGYQELRWGGGDKKRCFICSEGNPQPARTASRARSPPLCPCHTSPPRPSGTGCRDAPSSILVSWRGNLTLPPPGFVVLLLTIIQVLMCRCLSNG